jgi:hypothetical protein
VSLTAPTVIETVAGLESSPAESVALNVNLSVPWKFAFGV